MNDEQRYLFDLQGYLHLPNIIPASDLDAMNAWIDEKAEQDLKFRSQTRNTHVDHPITWAPEFQALLDHPVVLSIMKELVGEKLRLDHDYAIFLEPGHTGLKLHGPNETPFDPCHYYRCANGKIHCGLVVATYALTDVPPGAGGLAVISGSHKSNFECPTDIKLLQRYSPIVQQVPCRAGDCVVFTEALVHGTLPWQGPSVRRTLFFKYAPCSLAWANRAYFPTELIPEIDAVKDRLTVSQRLLLDPPSAIDFHKVP